MYRGLTPILQEMANYNYAPHQKDLGNKSDRISHLSSDEFQKTANQTAPFLYNDQQTNSHLMKGLNQSHNASRPKINQPSASSRVPLQPIEDSSTLASEGHWKENSGESANIGVPSVKQEIASPQEPSFTNVKRLPLRLPQAPLRFISNPRDDLPEHLYRHGLAEDAMNFAMAKGITVDFALSKWVQHSGSEGANGLLKMTCWLMDTFQDNIKEQLSQAQAKNQALPRQFTIPTANLNRKIQEGNALGENLSLPPSHVLAIHSNQASAGEENGMLIPCHAMLYVLQCVSLPRFGESTVTMETYDNNGSSQSFPVVPILVPRPKEFVLLHQFIYTRDASALLMALLPLWQIVQRVEQKITLQHQFANTSLNDNASYGSSLPVFTNTILGTEGSVQLFSKKSASQHAIEFLSDQPAHDLFSIAYRINAVWANGVAIGLTDVSFWNALQTGWTLIITALACKKGRYIDIESRGLNIGLRK